MITLAHYLTLSAALFCIALFGALTSRSALRVIVCVELMFNAVNVNLIAFALYSADEPTAGLSFVVLLVVMAAAEIGLALALVVNPHRSGDISAIHTFNLLRDKEEIE